SLPISKFYKELEKWENIVTKTMASCTDAASNDESTAEDVKSDSEDDCLDADSIGRSYDADLMREMEV
ncbi:hypothetical protein L917_07106, partial [Phytophthora nicotianae]